MAPPRGQKRKAPTVEEKTKDVESDVEVQDKRVSHPRKGLAPRKNGAVAAREKKEVTTPPKKGGRAAKKTEDKEKARGRAPSLNSVKPRPSVPAIVYVFGKGEMAELGLGPAPNARIVKRPRINHFLLPDKVGVVQIACGGMHSLALTKDGKVYSWGVNDQGALGRDTKWEAPTKDADATDSEDEEGEINPKESTPGLVEGLPENINIVQVAAGDSISVAVTDEGYVYAWGTFRCSDGILGFSERSRVALRPARIPTLKDVVQVVTGTDHILALTKTGNVFAWGNGQQFQLGRRVVERTRLNGLSPREFGLHNIKIIGAGSYHSFAIDDKGKVFAWGVNQYAQCGLYDDEDSPTGGALIPVPTHVKALDGYDIVHITGGEHHSAAITKEGDLLMWGRIDANEVGLDRSKIDSSFFVKDVSGKDRFLTVPTKIPDMKFSWIGCGGHHNVAIRKEDGSAWSWGFGESYQVGLGPGTDDVEFPTQIVNTATKGVRMFWSGCGGQFSVLMGNPDPSLEVTEAEAKEREAKEKEATKAVKETNGVNGSS
ncbi:regulator of chromosome condensation 1/beta-lactamase-inhibitor protein II [Kalaharituber pfeilii]|nr:regulator of chromosome condensation 1/beta-lactamase-inhibitor protein II [Kalaharituber pfeilii]